VSCPTPAPGAFAIGDTVFAGKRVAYPGIPMFSPELFCYMSNPNPSKYKQFIKGLDELLGECRPHATGSQCGEDQKGKKCG